eukprot:UN02979
MKLKEQYKNARWVPLDLRTKGTRKWRQRLTLSQKSKLTERQSKKAENRRQRLYVLPK